MGVVVIILAAAYGVAAGLLLPRAAYRLSVEPEEPWRDRCPEGHPVPGWLGLARCRVPAGLDPAPGAAPPRKRPRAAPGLSGAPPQAPRLNRRRGWIVRLRPGARASSRGSLRHGSGRSPGNGGRAGRGEGATQRHSHGYGPRTARTAALTGVVCGALAAAVGGRPEAVVFVGLAPVLVLLGLVDLAVHRLPDPLTLPLAAGTVALLGAAAPLPGAAGSWRLALLGGAALGGSYLVLFVINPAGLGFGDVKLALALGVALGWYGWGVWAVGAFLGFAYGALYGLGLVLRGPEGRKQAFPFGPFMAAGALTGVVLGGFGA